MKKSIKNFIWISLFMCSIFYLMFSFIKWDFNPSNWHQDTRALLSIIMIVCMLIASLISAAISDNKSQYE